MQDKIEVGEYIRTRKGDIRQVVKRDIDNHILLDVVFEGLNYLTHIEEKEDIAKHSKYKLELIEEGDYVNGYKVISVDYDVENPYIDCIELDLNNNYQYNFISINQIKSIVTKEQFQSMEYKVGK